MPLEPGWWPVAAGRAGSPEPVQWEPESSTGLGGRAAAQVLCPPGFLWVASETFLPGSLPAAASFPQPQVAAPWAGNNVLSPRLRVEVSSLAPSGWQPLPASFGTLLAKAVTFLSVGWVELLCKLPLSSFAR